MNQSVSRRPVHPGAFQPRQAAARRRPPLRALLVAGPVGAGVLLIGLGLRAHDSTVILCGVALLLTIVTVSRFRRAASLRRALEGVRSEQEIIHRRHGEELLRREADFRQLFADNPQPMLVFDRATLQNIDANAAAVALYGYTREELLSMAVTQLRVSEQGQPVTDPEAPPRSHSGGQWRHRTKDGRVIFVDTVRHELTFHDHPAMLVLVSDITERTVLEERLRHLAFHDPLTGLPNRDLFLDRLRHALGRDARDRRGTAVMVLDLDDFKTVNDRLGHAAGDAVLTQSAQRLQSCLRPGDSACRLGGDEFAIILEGTGDRGTVSRIAQRVLEALDAPIAVDGVEVQVTASIGAALSRLGTRSLADLIGDADAAMYAAKTEGKNRLRIFEAGMRADASERVAVEQELRGVVDRGELRVVYQLQTETRGGSVVGVEALVRWEHPTRGLIPPDEFVPLAERLGLIREIDRHVLRSAAVQVAAWQRRGAVGLRLAVNLSAAEIEDPTIVALVEDVLRDTGLPADTLELEITETVAIRHHTTVVPVLRRLRDLGVQIAIDDFGTGYSVLSRLRDFPATTLKIDRSFTRVIDHAAADEPLVAAIIALGHSLGLRVVAEGVETEAQRDWMRRNRCDELQGYLSGRPMPAGAIELLLADPAALAAPTAAAVAAATATAEAVVAAAAGVRPPWRPPQSAGSAARGPRLGTVPVQGG